MSDIQNSPLTDEDAGTTEDEVFEIVWFRAFSSDEDWAQDPASVQFDLTREQAADRLAREDYSPLA